MSGINTTPTQVEKSRPKRSRTGRIRNRKFNKSKKRQYKRFSIDTFTKDYGDLLGPYLTELCKMQLLRRKQKSPRYTPFQKWIATNILVSTSISGYRLLSTMFALPSSTTIIRSLRKFKTPPGINDKNLEMLKLKVNPTSDRERYMFILIDEMSIRVGLGYDQSSGSVFGFSDNGQSRSNKLATSALCIMGVGVMKRWKYPLGYFFTDSVMKSDDVIDVIKTAIDKAEATGFTVLGLTTDQGTNFEKAFRSLGVTIENPKFSHRNKSYFIHRDPPHLVKNARNFLHKGPVKVPGQSGKASWTHLEKLYAMDKVNSLKIVPKITSRHVGELQFAAKMKVKLATQIMSHSVAAALDYMVAINRLESDALATSAYCKMVNDIFDTLNSLSSRDSVMFRRPLHSKSPSIVFLTSAKEWLYELQRMNLPRRCHFINGFIQSINVILQLNTHLAQLKFPYLSTRNICQDPLELYFGKVRSTCKFPQAHNFANCYARLTAASLIRAPLTGNCENLDHSRETVAFMNYVSILIIV